MLSADFITNAEVYIRSGLQSIQSMVRRRRLSLFGHIARMPDYVLAKALPGCTIFVQTVACQLETPSTVPMIGPCGKRMLRPPRPCVDDDDILYILYVYTFYYDLL